VRACVCVRVCGCAGAEVCASGVGAEVCESGVGYVFDIKWYATSRNPLSDTSRNPLSDTAVSD